VPIEELSSSDLADIAAELVRTPARPDRSCWLGDVGGCADGLGIRSEGAVLDTWYAPATWPRLAAMAGGPVSGLETVDRQRCIDLADLDACRRFLLPERILMPVGVVGRQYLVQMALNGGGDSA
jgi:hypothetical protein